MKYRHEVNRPECTSEKHCVIGKHHVKSLDASVSVLHHGYGAWSRHKGSFQLVWCPHLPDLTSPMKYRHEVNRPECTSEKHCVIGRHHVKSLDASVSVLHHGYGAWSRHKGSFQLVCCPRLPLMTMTGGPSAENNCAIDLQL